MSEGSELLDSLGGEGRNTLLPLLIPVRFEIGKILYDPGETVDHCYFPCGDAVASFQILFDTGIAVETLMVGREGAVGGIVGGGGIPAYARATVLHGGQFLRVSAEDLERAQEESPELRRLIARYSDCLLANVFQSAACNAIHTIEQRAAKWLIGATARIGRGQIMMTQEQLASMLGVGRSYASRVVQRFKADGIVRTRRGGIDVLDPILLEQRACTCDLMVQRHVTTIMAEVHHAH